MLSALGLSVLLYKPADVHACCVGCIDDCDSAADNIPDSTIDPDLDHTDGRPQIKEDITELFPPHKDWIVDEWFEPRWAVSLQLITRYLSNVTFIQAFMLGTLMDGKHFSETVRDMQEMHFQAYKDYQPSPGICTYGTALRTMNHTESAAKATSLGLSRQQLARHLGKSRTGGASNRGEDKRNRWEKFTEFYCDPQDNNWLTGVANTGLSNAFICGNVGGGNTDRINIDVDYGRAIENKRTLDISASNWSETNQLTDILALGNNLYGHDILTRNISQNNLKNKDLQQRYLRLRAVTAKRNVAENSFNSIVGLKSRGADNVNADGQPPDFTDTSAYLGRLLVELGIPEDEIAVYLGNTRHPSYYAVLEILAKKIYQNPQFYAELYDTPANVKRKSAALKAVELMLDRALFESELRQEMAMSVLLSSRMEVHASKANKNLGVFYNVAK